MQSSPAASPTPPPPPPHRSRARSWLLRALAVLLITLVALMAALVWLLRSDAGTAFVLARVPGLEVQGLRGSLGGGSFEVSRLQWRQGEAVLNIDTLAWTDLRWRFRPHAEAWVGVALIEPQARRIEWRSGPPGEPGPPLQAPANLRLPVAAQIEGLRIGELQVDELPLVTDIRLSLDVGSEGGAVHRVRELALVAQDTQVSLHAQIGADAPMALQGQVRAESTAKAAQAFTATVDLGGELARPTLAARLRSTEPPAEVDAQATLLPFAPWPLAALEAQARNLDLALLAEGAPATQLDAAVVVRSSGLDAPIEADVQLTNRLPGRWDELRLPLAQAVLTVRGNAQDRSTLTLPRFELQLADGREAAGSLQGSGQWHGDTLNLDTRIEALHPARLDNRAPAMTLGGPLTLRLRGLPSPDPSAAPASAPPATLPPVTPPPATPPPPGASPGTAPVPAAASALWADLKTELEGRLIGGKTPPVSLSADVGAGREGETTRIEVRSLHARAAGADARLTAQATQAADGAWQLRSEGALKDFDPQPWWPGAADNPWRQGPHRVNASWDADLRTPARLPEGDAMALLQALRGKATLALTNSRLAGLPLAGKLAWNHAGNAAGLQADADLQLAGNRFVLEGRDGTGDAARWRADVQAPALAALAPLGRLAPNLQDWMPRSGSVELQGSARGTWPAMQTEGTLRVTRLAANLLSVPQLQARWNLAPPPNGNADAPLELTVDGRELAYDGRKVEQLKLLLDGSWRTHRLEIDASSSLRPPAWADRLLAGPGGTASIGRGSAARVRADGAWRPGSAGTARIAGLALGGGEWSGRVTELLAGARTGAAEPWLAARDLRARVQLDAQGGVSSASAEQGRIEVLGAGLRWNRASWSTTAPGASAGRPRIDLDVDIEPLQIAPWLAGLQPDSGWGGDLAIGGHVRIANDERFRADVLLERRGGDLHLTDAGGRQEFGLSNLRLALEAQDGTWHFTQGMAGRTVGVLAGAQSLRMSPQAMVPPAGTPLEGVLELRVADLGVWGPWLPPGWRIGGSLRTSASLGGTFGAPEYTGQVVGADLTVRNLLQGVDVRDGRLGILLRGADATIDQFVFKGGDGELRLEGGATFGAEPRAQVKAVMERFQVLGRLDRQAIVSGNADLDLNADTLALKGTLKVDEGLFDFSYADAPSLDSDVTVVQRPGEDAPETDPDAPAGGPAVRNTNVALRLDMGEQFRLRGRGLETLLRGNLNITTPGGRLAVNGRIRTEKGSYVAYGQKMEIERGVIAFGGVVDNPRLDILALRRGAEVRVGVAVGGTAQNPRISLYSDPEMSEVDKLSWLIMGRGPDGLGRTDMALLQRAALALISGEGEGASDQFIRNIGLDEFSVRQDGVGDTRDTIVTVGKQLSERWYVGYERGVNATEGSWQLIYRAAQRVTLRAQAGFDNALDVIWTWRWN